ncbi:MAG: hypothetical protein HKL84_02925 [Acidimicrobiaceae bacterium]|nr:hypothetical protein [Acidimicrobiaceae bacterium]
MTDITEPLSTSRQFQLTRRVALSDTDPSGRLRLDACARFLQDVAAFDAIDADISVLGNWILRRNTISVASLPTYGTRVLSNTYLTGSGRAWVERTSVISDIDSGRIYLTARALWVLTHSGTGAPISVPEALYDVYGPLALQHKITIRDAKRELLPPGASLLPWQIRYCDQDILSHLNNATYLEALEEVLHRENIDIGPDQPMTCQVIFRESTSYNDQSDVYFLISEDDGTKSVRIYFTNNNQVRTNIELTLSG